MLGRCKSVKSRKSKNHGENVSEASAVYLLKSLWRIKEQPREDSKRAEDELLATAQCRAVDSAKDCRGVNRWQGLGMRDRAFIMEGEWCGRSTAEQ